MIPDRIKKMLLVALGLMPLVAWSACTPTGRSETPDTSLTTDSIQPTEASATSPILRDTVASERAFIVVSKRDLNLRVYDITSEGDTVLLAQFPVCLSKNKGNKQRRGDMRTPESPAGKPFKITQIQDASNWRHDFNDGRGNILAYGKWFLRLLTPGHSGIGIHGSTNNETSVPGRASEGCIRLRDADIITLKERYAYVGMPVIIKAEGQGLLDWEQRIFAQPR